MAKVKLDWSVLRGSIVVLMICAIISASLLGSTFYFTETIDAEHRREQKALRAARTDYLDLDEEKELIEIYYPRFQALEALGIFGDEQRLNWTETLQNAAARLKLPSLSYAIQPRHAATPSFPIKKGRFHLFASDLRLKAGLLHEADLPDLLYEIETYGSGLFTVTGCRMQLVGNFRQQNPTRPIVKAECLLRWYTIRLGGET